MKKIITSFLFICLLSVQITAIPSIVHDPLNYLTAIDSLYASYDQIMTAIKQLEQQYESYKQAVEAVKGFRFDEIKWDGDFDFRNEIRGSISSVNRQLTNVRRLKNVFTRPSLTANGHSFSIADLVGAGRSDHNVLDFFGAHQEEIKKRQDLVKKAFTKGLSQEERMAISRKYGYSPENYMMVQHAKAQLKSQLGKAIAATSEVGSEEWMKAQFMKYGPVFEKAMGENASPKQVQQALLQAEQLIAEHINLLGTNLNEIGALIAKNIHLKEQQEEANRERDRLVQEIRKANIGVSAMFRGGNSLADERDF